MAFSVIVTQKGGATRRLEFDKDEITIGRMEENDICLPAGNISKKHTRIFFKEGKFIIVDLKSTNGTFVNGKKIAAPQVLRANDQIAIGDYILNMDNGDVSEYESDAEPTVAQDEPTPAAPTPMPMPEPGELTGPQPMVDAGRLAVAVRPSAPPAPAAAVASANVPGSQTRAQMGTALRELYAGACEALAAGVDGDLRTVAEDAVRRHQEVMASSRMWPAGMDVEAAIQAAVSEVAGLGALEFYLDDRTVSEIVIAGPDVVTIVRGGRSELSERFFSSDEALLSTLARLFSPGGTDRLAGFTMFADVATGGKPRIHLVLRRRA